MKTFKKFIEENYDVYLDMPKDYMKPEDEEKEEVEPTEDEE